MLYLAATAGRLEERVEPFFSFTPTIVEYPMSTVTFSKVASGVTYTRTYTRNDGESETDFDVRAKALWTQFCTLHGI